MSAVTDFAIEFSTEFDTEFSTELDPESSTEFPPTVRVPERARTPHRTVSGRPVATAVGFPGATAGAGAGPSCLTRVPRPVLRAAPAVSGTPVVRWATEPVIGSSAVHLTRRGWAVLLGVATLVAAVLLWVAWLSHDSAVAGTVAAPASVASQVTVQPGDTLWSIATRVAPHRDPRAVVYDLQQRNHLTSAAVLPGQVLRVS